MATQTSSAGQKFASLANKNILLGISGSIAAYKACELLRLFQQQGAQTRVVMTRQATEFITPLTLQALSGNPVHTELVDYQAEASMGHIQMARWADAMVVAPASATSLARFASGEASDLLSAVFLATTAPRLLAPAMNKEMWAKAEVQQNIKSLAKQANTIIVQPSEGWQACGEVGSGRLADLEDILAATAQEFASGLLAGKKVLLTAGPTREPLDSARFLSNYSSGKMGYALAEACVEAGAEVVLVSGPVALGASAKVKCVAVETAEEMLAACEKEISTADILIATAAVADWRPASRAKGKLPKGSLGENLPLAENPDIVAELAKLAAPNSIKVGFAAEADKAKLEANAEEKLKAKGLDLVVANDLTRAFAADDSEVLLVSKTGKPKRLPLARKSTLARQLVAEIAKLL